MDERFPDEFVIWKHKTFAGIKVEEVFGMDSKPMPLWKEMARQVFSESSDTGFRELGHFESGVPYMAGYKGRISISHTPHLFVVAVLPKTPEVDLSVYNPRSAMGVDVENLDREQVLKVRKKFLSEEELILVPENDLTSNILAWTSKEALYKAGLHPGLDFIESLRILKLPRLEKDPLKGDRSSLGKAIIKFPDSVEKFSQEMELFSYESYGCCVTIAFSPKCAKYTKKPA